MKFPRFLLIVALCLGLALVVPAIAADEGAGQSDADMGAGAAVAQQQAPGAQQPPEEGAAAPGAQPAEQMREVEGEISNVDMENRTVRVGGFAGLFGTDLQVTDQTRIVPAPGAPAADFSSLKEGDRVRASYQRVGDRNVANEIVILSPAAGEGAGAPPAAGEEGAGGPPAGGAPPPEQQPGGGGPHEGGGGPSY